MHPEDRVSLRIKATSPVQTLENQILFLNQCSFVVEMATGSPIFLWLSSTFGPWNQPSKKTAPFAALRGTPVGLAAGAWLKKKKSTWWPRLTSFSVMRRSFGDKTLSLQIVYSTRSVFGFRHIKMVLVVRYAYILICIFNTRLRTRMIAIVARPWWSRELNLLCLSIRYCCF